VPTEPLPLPSSPTDVLHLCGPIRVSREEIRDQAWVIGGRITYERPRAARDVREVPGWVVPGLVDAHCHVGLAREGRVDDETALAQAHADRDAGTLLIRDAGQPGDTRWLDGREDVPEIIRAGHHIARTRRYIRGYAREIEPEDLVAVVLAEAARGDGWVKLVGDWIDRDRGDLGPCWSADALVAAIAAAHVRGVRVTAHCFGEDCLPDLIAAGIDCIEHATGLTDGTRAAVAAAGIPIVPTLVNIANFPAFARAGEAKFPVYAKHMRDLHARRYANVRAAHEAGVPVYCGTDAGGQLPHGLVVQEVQELAKAGLGDAAALDAACWSARTWLGRPGLEEGAPADLLVLAEDPCRDVRVLGDPRMIVLRGRPVRADG